MNHTLDFTKKPTRKRALRVLSWIQGRVSEHKPTGISMREIYDIYGNVSRGISKQLFELTLAVADPYYNTLTGVCKQYVKRVCGVEQLQLELGIDSVPVLPHIDLQLTQGTFEYTEKSDRLWNPIQFWNKDHRLKTLARYGYVYHYDIVSAAPTLLYQRAKHIYRDKYLTEFTPKQQQQRSAILKLDAIEQLINDRTQFRQQIAQSAGITQGEAKTVINALFQGSSLTTAWNSKLFQELNRRDSVIRKLQENEQVCALRKDIRKMWEYLADDCARTHTASGRLKRLGGIEKSKLYRQLELCVGGCIRRCLKSKTTSQREPVWIHDGWSQDEYVDPRQLELTVRTKTGYTIKLEVYKFEEQDIE